MGFSSPLITPTCGNQNKPAIGSVRYVNTSWWRHQMKALSALLALCAGNSPITGEFPAQSPVTWSFDVFFDLRLHKRLSKPSWGWWFEMPSRSLWRHCNVLPMISNYPILINYTENSQKGFGEISWHSECSRFIWCSFLSIAKYMEKYGAIAASSAAIRSVIRVNLLHGTYHTVIVTLNVAASQDLWQVMVAVN